MRGSHEEAQYLSPRIERTGTSVSSKKVSIGVAIEVFGLLDSEGPSILGSF